MSDLTEEEKLRYARQITLADFGEGGQSKIKQSRILVVGLGGLGTFSSLLLAEIGVGYLRIVDRDIVEQTNLHRTPLYTIADLDRAKVEVAGDRLKKLNPSMTVDTHACHVGSSNIDDLIDGIDIVIDALDNFETRRIINQACVRNGIPFIFCGVSVRSGNITVFNLGKESPCLSCLYHGVNDDDLESCDITGIHPAILPIVTGIQVYEALDILIHGKSSLDSSLLFIDLQNLSFDKIPIQKNPNCPVCSDSSDYDIISPVSEYQTIEICGGSNYMLVPQMKVSFNLPQINSQIKGAYTVTKTGTHSLTLLLPDNVLVTIFKGGNVLIRGVISAALALKIWKEIKRVVGL
ncbi:MAG: HesA/MoeB/ThiF family protein [Candidatus Heimdallarchaeota archaeon]|nr:MAG: HesA/MoeB/ThiF family protein [Candidatus Heimdallarchaeota archaeon]